MDIFVAVLFYLLVASLIHSFCRKRNLPYTIILFVIGVAISPLSSISAFAFLDSLTLTPELLFYVFLPVLIFESGYAIRHQQLSQNSLAIRTLATLGMSLSAGIVGGGLWFISSRAGRGFPREMTVFFGVIISATDPVAVLSLFKKLGTPHRLNLLFEGESLFNDGTAVALFLVLVGIVQEGSMTWGLGLEGFLTFLVMIVGGVILGVLWGLIFAKAIHTVTNNEVVEVTLTMILAHITFISAELMSEYIYLWGWNMQISGVIATAFAAIIMGNYGKSKISPRVETYMDKFWNFFAFLANSFVFLLMGDIVWDIDIPLQDFWIPASTAIILVSIARAISVYIPIGLVNMGAHTEKIPLSWQHLMAWGSLRGAIGLVLVLLLPDDFYVPGWEFAYSFKDFLLALVISAIVFSLLVKGLSMPWCIRRLQLDKLQDLEHFERLELAIMVYQRIVYKIETMKDDYHICKENYDALRDKYYRKHDQAIKDMKLFLAEHDNAKHLIHRALSLHALGIEKQYLAEMFRYNECTESMYIHLQSKLERQVIRIEKGQPQCRYLGYTKEQTRTPLLQKLMHMLQSRLTQEREQYIIARTKFIISYKVIEGLRELQSLDFGYDSEQVAPIIALYEQFNHNAQNTMQELSSSYPYLIDKVNSVLLNKGLMKTEEHIVMDFWKKEMITDKLYTQFMKEIETEILKNA